MQAILLKYGAMLGTILGILYGSYLYGYSEAEEKAELKRLELVEKQAEERLKYEARLSKVNKELLLAQAKTNQTNTQIEKDVDDYVQSSNADITLDDEWLRLKQRILESANTRPELTK